MMLQQNHHLGMIKNRRIVMVLCLMALLAILVSGCSKNRVHQVSHKSKPVSKASQVPDAIPRSEPKSRYGNPESYEQFGKRYWVLDESSGYEDQGIASWYGKKFHGRRTSSGETYDMYKMTAAHKTLPIPAYVEVTNLRNGRKVVVRVNDRGPFHQNRIIDLSYVAAQKLDIVREGTGMVEVRVIDPTNPFRHETSQQNVAVQQPPVSKLSTPSVTVERELPVRSAASQPVMTNTEQAHSASPAIIQEPTAMESIDERSVHAIEQVSPPSQQFFVQLGAFSDKANAERLRRESQAFINQAVSIVSDEKLGQRLYKVRVGPLDDVASTDAIVSDLHSAGIHEHKIIFQ